LLPATGWLSLVDTPGRGRRPGLAWGGANAWDSWCCSSSRCAWAAI